MGDHTETFQVDFDPAVISYAQLLELFWQGHNPQRKMWSRQYMAIVLTHNTSQYEQALRSKEAVAEALQARISTMVAPLQTFYRAEDYHQKYYFQNTPLMAEIEAIYPKTLGWIDSTAVARINGYLSGYGTAATFDEDVKQLGLSPKGEHYLQQAVDGQRTPLTCPMPT